MLKNYCYLFILTYGRSGSTLLMKILNGIQGIEIKGENNNALFHLYRSIDAATRSRKDHATRTRGTDDPWFGAAKIEPDRFAEHCLDSFVADVLSPGPDARLIGFKEIRHLPGQMDLEEFRGYVNFILASFPDSKIIFNTRDGTQVARSGWFRGRPESEVIKSIQTADGWFGTLAAEEPDCFLIDYQDVVQNGARMAELMRFVGVDHDAAAVAKVLSVPLRHIGKRPKYFSLALRWIRRGVRRVLR